jgi:hypothetical protein
MIYTILEKASNSSAYALSNDSGRYAVGQRGSRRILGERLLAANSQHLYRNSAGGFDAVAANVTKCGGIADNDRIGARIGKNTLPQMLRQICVDGEFAFQKPWPLAAPPARRCPLFQTLFGMRAARKR